MAVLLKSRYSQDVRVAEFVANYNDTMVSTAGGTAVDFGLTNVTATSFDVIELPPNAVVIGGHLAVETAFDTASYAVVIGDSSSANRYHASADRKAAAVTALTVTGFRNTSGLPIRIGITNADVCTTGKFTLRVEYVIADRANEVA